MCVCVCDMSLYFIYHSTGRLCRVPCRCVVTKVGTFFFTNLFGVIVALMAFSRLGHLWSAASAGRKGWHQWGSTEVVTSAGWTSGATYENIMNHMVHDYQCELLVTICSNGTHDHNYACEEACWKTSEKGITIYHFSLLTMVHLGWWLIIKITSASARFHLPWHLRWYLRMWCVEVSFIVFVRWF